MHSHQESGENTEWFQINANPCNYSQCVYMHVCCLASKAPEATEHTKILDLGFRNLVNHKEADLFPDDPGTCVL